MSENEIVNGSASEYGPGKTINSIPRDLQPCRTILVVARPSHRDAIRSSWKRASSIVVVTVTVNGIVTAAPSITTIAPGAHRSHLIARRAAAAIEAALPNFPDIVRLDLPQIAVALTTHHPDRERSLANDRIIRTERDSAAHPVRPLRANVAGVVVRLQAVRLSRRRLDSRPI